jgi:hypothetical protein
MEAAMSELRAFYWLCIIKLCRLFFWLQLDEFAEIVARITGLRTRLEAFLGGRHE